MMEGEMGERDRGGCRISKNCMIDNIDMNTRDIGEMYQGSICYGVNQEQENLSRLSVTSADSGLHKD